MTAVSEADGHAVRLSALPSGAIVMERGWMHGNVVLLPGRVPSIVDTGYHTGFAALSKHMDEVFLHQKVSVVALTHTHSDHAGCVAALQNQLPLSVVAHVDTARMVRAWDTQSMWLGASGQELPRYSVTDSVKGGDQVELGNAQWHAIHTPGHATGGLSWFDPHSGVLVTGDALWEFGLGILNPWMDGWHVFDDAHNALDRILETNACWVVPGHGPPFVDLRGAVDRARSRVDYFARNPERLQVQIVRSCAGFVALARPGLSPQEVRDIAHQMVVELGLPAERVGVLVAEVSPS